VSQVTIIDPRDEAKRPSKAKHEERTQRNKEMDEFYREHLHRMNRRRGTGLTGWHRIHRCYTTGVMGQAMPSQRGEVRVAPVTSVVLS